MNKEELLELLASKGLTVGSVESLTAGLFGATYCSIPGASRTYRGGIISYAAEIKTSLVDVPKSLIEEKGVVSAEVACEMAEGGAKKLGVDLCLSCTGNAGPTAEKGEAPVGRVYIGLHFNGKTQAYEVNFEGPRNVIRAEVVEKMFEILSQNV